MGKIHRQLFDPKDIAQEMRQYFKEVETRCGKPWERVVSRNDVDQKANETVKHGGVPGLKPGTSHDRVRSLSGSTYQYVRGGTLGWRPTCACDAGEPVPCLCLDPFGGAGTVGLVAMQLGRRAVLVEKNAEYCELAWDRMQPVAKPKRKASKASLLAAMMEAAQ